MPRMTGRHNRQRSRRIKGLRRFVNPGGHSLDANEPSDQINEHDQDRDEENEMVTPCLIAAVAAWLLLAAFVVSWPPPTPC